MSQDLRSGRANQKRRTRRALMEAATRLIAADRSTPTMAEIAEEAGTSVATAYRYFSSIDTLLDDAALNVLVPTVEETVPDTSGTATQRIARVEEMINSVLLDNEIAVNLVIRAYAQEWLDSTPEGPAPRPGRRLNRIDLALRPFARKLGKERLNRLRNALALTIGTESVITLRSVCSLEKEEAREVTAWAAQALVRQAFAEAGIEP